MTSQWKAVCGVVLVFIFGCLSGWFGASVMHYRETTQFLQGGPEAVAKLLETRMTRNLSLDEIQKEKIHQYFMDNLVQRKLLQIQIQPQLQLVNRETFQEINAILRPDQQKIFRQNITLFRQRTGKSPFNPNPAIQPSPYAITNHSGSSTGASNPNPMIQPSTSATMNGNGTNIWVDTDQPVQPSTSGATNANTGADSPPMAPGQ
jgi:hypothetical protein